MENNSFYVYESSIATLLLQSDKNGENIKKILYADFTKNYTVVTDVTKKKPEIINTLESELTLYFNGRLKVFTVKFLIEGTNFEKTVYKATLDIDYGQTKTYAYLAKKINNEKASRAVGGALSKNKINIIIPCHRVIGSSSLVGYGGGIDRKKYLLDFENSSYHN